MKKLTALILVISLVSFTKRDNPFFDIKSFKKDYAKIRNNMFVGKYEVTNLEYRNFLAGLVNSNQPEIYKSCLPDTLCWREKLAYNEPYVEYYFRSPSFGNYPVVGVSYEAAKDYCSWLTKNYNESPKRKFKKVFFKLLSREEWEFAANSGDTNKVYTWGSGFMQNNRKQFLCNFKHKQFDLAPGTSDNSLNERSAIVGPVNSFFPSSFGMYNMCGNVAEMIEEKGIAKGGSYNDPAWEVRISSEKTYTRPRADIGFRVAMKVIEE